MTTAVVQARMGSSRLPGKVLRPLGASTVLAWVVRAAEASTAVDEVVVATTTEPADRAVAEVASALGCRVVRGPEDDVLSRFLLAIDGLADGDIVVRLTADCPLLDPEVITAAVHHFSGAGLDYLSVAGLPRGLDVEVTSVAALRGIDELAAGVERVHVTPRFYRHPDAHALDTLTFAPDASDLRVTLDTPEDASLIEAVVAALGDGPHPWEAVVALLRARPDLVALNAAIRQKAVDEG